MLKNLINKNSVLGIATTLILALLTGIAEESGRALAESILKEDTKTEE